MTIFNINAFHEGDARMWNHVYEKLKEPLIRIAISILADSQFAEDLIHDTLIAAWEQRGKYDSFSYLESSVRIIIRNKSINELRIRQQQGKLVTTTDMQDPEAPLSREDQPPLYQSIEDELLRTAILKQIEAEITRLPKQMQKVFRLRRLEGLTSDETAEQLGTSSQTVRNQYARAREKIALRLRETGYQLIISILGPLLALFFKIISLFV